MKIEDLRPEMYVGLGHTSSDVGLYCKVIETHAKEVVLLVINGGWFLHLSHDGGVRVGRDGEFMPRKVRVSYAGAIPDAFKGDYGAAMDFIQLQLMRPRWQRALVSALLRVTQFRRRFSGASRAAYRAFFREMGWTYKATKQDQWEDRINDDIPF